MAMDCEAYARCTGLEPTPETLARINRVREAGVYLRARSYRNYRRDLTDVTGDRHTAACRASYAFEARHLGLESGR